MYLKLPSNLFMEVDKNMPNIYLHCFDRDKRHAQLSSILSENESAVEFKVYHEYDYHSTKDLERIRIQYDKLLEIMKFREKTVREKPSENLKDLLILADYVRKEDILKLIKISRGLSVHWIVGDYLSDTPVIDLCPLIFVVPPYNDYCKLPNRTIVTLT